MKKLVVLAAVLALSACGSKPEGAEETTATSSATGAEVAATDAAPSEFGQCAICHKVDKDGGNGLGPNLHGIVGRKSAAVAGFNYSPAMKASGVTWDEASLDKYVESPQGFMSGTKMSFAGQKDPAKRKAIIAWLKKNS